MEFKTLSAIFNDEPKFRYRQAVQEIFGRLISDWSEAVTLPKYLREKLAAECPLKISAIIDNTSDGRTFKAALTYKDSTRIETVLMRHSDGRNTVCVSSQAGCALGCDFCLTGKMGFSRNLKSGEIVDQALYFARYLKKFNERITNIVFMGMGEPFLNYREVIKAAKIFHDTELFNISARKISLSTVGVIPGINLLAKEKLPFNLAVSIHAPNDKLRSKLMPINLEYPLIDLLSAVADYIKLSKRRVMIEYVLLKGINDSPNQAEELAELLLNNLEGLYVVNLISYNKTGEYEPALRSAAARFKIILEKKGIEVVERYRFGSDIKAACGQLALE